MKKFGITLLALSLVVFLAWPAAAEFDPYGSVRVLTGWNNYDPNDGTDDDDDLTMALSDISRFGAKMQTGDLGGRVEFGLKGEPGNGVYSRLLYGTWDFGAGTLLVGQDWTPYTFWSEQIAPRLAPLGRNPSNYEAENGFVGYGCLWDSRQPQIKLKLENGFYLALIRPNTDDKGGYDVDQTLPKMVVGFDYKREGLRLNPGFAYNTYDIEGGGDDETIDSYLIYLNGKVAMGMVDLQGSVHYGQNLDDFGLWNREDAATAQIDADGDIEDSDCWGGYLQLAFNIDPATITLGYGYVQSENDALGDEDDAQQSYFVNAKIPIADTFYVVPEISFYDHMEDFGDADEAEVWWAGLLWRMDF
jgi:hypothetical protein